MMAAYYLSFKLMLQLVGLYAENIRVSKSLTLDTPDNDNDEARIHLKVRPSPRFAKKVF
jgi:hypothetical protein